MDLQRTRDMHLYVAERMIDSTELLTKMDQAIGDGDHGLAMAKGFEAIALAIGGKDFEDLAGLFKTVGMTMLTSAGGASGAIYGTFYQGASKKLTGRDFFDAEALSILLVEGLGAVQKRGKAEVGQKTMVDALHPAAEASLAHAGQPLAEMMPKVAEAARLGMESTKEMVAAMGRARYLGQRAVGHPDPGAVSTHLILKFMTGFIQQEDG